MCPSTIRFMSFFSQFSNYLVLCLFLGSIGILAAPSPTVPSYVNGSQAPSYAPPSSMLVVRQNTTNVEEFSTIQGALNALQNCTGLQRIYIHGGLYNEQLVIDYKHPLIVQGETNDSTTYIHNKVTIQNALSAKEAGNDSASATVNVSKHDFAMYNINLVNNYGEGTDTQALALTAKGSRQGFYACSFSSFQDTLRTYRGTQLYSRCYIEGAVDFIFGRDSMAWFEQTTIGIKLSKSKETITASGRNYAESLGFFLFNRANIISVGAQPATAFLGRPWGVFARVGFQNSYMSDVINPAGWVGWNVPEDPRTDFISFQEFNNTGPGAIGKRELTEFIFKPYIYSDILQLNYTEWVDFNYLD
ncbi:pectin lyase fold/virulence factor [Melampsora americana]|nr:pectin lyase fold/virulence factor [Melampsora americana]